jgi:hypothetical protein
MSDEQEVFLNDKKHYSHNVFRLWVDRTRKNPNETNKAKEKYWNRKIGRKTIDCDSLGILHQYKVNCQLVVWVIIYSVGAWVMSNLDIRFPLSQDKLRYVIIPWTNLCINGLLMKSCYMNYLNLIALPVIFPYPSYYLEMFAKDVYNKGRYTRHEKGILHTFCNTLFLPYNIQNWNLFLNIYFDRAIQNTVVI